MPLLLYASITHSFYFLDSIPWCECSTHCFLDLLLTAVWVASSLGLLLRIRLLRTCLYKSSFVNTFPFFFLGKHLGEGVLCRMGSVLYAFQETGREFSKVAV